MATTSTNGPSGVEDVIPVDVSNPVAVIAALGFDPPTVRAVVITTAGALGISASYPPTEFDPPPPAAEPPVTEE